MYNLLKELAYPNAHNILTIDNVNDNDILDHVKSKNYEMHEGDF